MNVTPEANWLGCEFSDITPSVTYGSPITSEMDTPGERGRMNRFSKDQHESAIYWSGATNAHEVHGGIYVKYFSLGEDKSYLGLPTTDELPSQGFSWAFLVSRRLMTGAKLRQQGCAPLLAR
jgi:hypothetical protein